MLREFLQAYFFTEHNSFISRREFLRLLALNAFALATGCTGQSTITRALPDPTRLPSSTLTPTPSTTATQIFPTNTATLTTTATPTLTPITENGEKREETVFDILMKPFIDEAMRKRVERKRKEPEWSKRIDEKLNDNKINFLLFGYGDTYEPKSKDDRTTKPVTIGSSTIASYDIKSGRFDFISFTHDIRAPEIEQLLREKNKGQAIPAQKIDQAFKVGGFDLLRTVHENATALAIDFQVSFKDVMIQRLVDQVFNGVAVEVPEDFDVLPFYLEGQYYPGAHFSQGKQNLKGLQVIQFIKTVPDSTKDYYGKAIEHKSRMYYVLRGLLDSLEKKGISAELLLKSAGFVTAESTPVFGSTQYDFNPVTLFANNVQTLVPSLQKYTTKGNKGIGLPTIGKTIYIHDANAGDGGVQWVHKNSNDYFLDRDFKGGVYAVEHDMAVPFEGDAFAPDPYTNYWPSVRALVKNKLMD